MAGTRIQFSVGVHPTVLHDATEHSTFDRDELFALALAEREIRNEETISRADILDRFDLEIPEG
ncbi:hypothetical protein MW046_10425 [Halocatena salina]|uniref:Uncharacterized protein n=1 Tax=Halocatena salina TaxID=2934340 RepID=A0A8U0A2Z0_9EURY|nr:hypothetical protein [Halocatena salina]UPM42373.1 hypothetical protein MW046_10425 [Halocatena salina]